MGVAKKGVYAHKDFDLEGNFITDDIALVKLDKPVDIKKGVAEVIPMAVEGDNFDGQECKMTGWGKTDGYDNTPLIPSRKSPPRRSRARSASPCGSTGRGTGPSRTPTSASGPARTAPARVTAAARRCARRTVAGCWLESLPAETPTAA